MKFLKIFFLILSLFSLYSCSTEEKEVSYVKETRQDLEIATAYNEAYTGEKTPEEKLKQVE